MDRNQLLEAPPTVAGAVSSAKPRRGLLLLTWLPIPTLLAAMIVLWAAHLGKSHGSDALIMALNLTFSTMVSGLVVYLVSRSFLTRGTPGLLTLGCGVIIWGAAGVVAKALNRHDANMDVTIHNVCVWLSAMFHFASAVLLLRARRPLRARGLWLGAAYVGTLGVLGLVALAALHGYTPTFFVQGAGGTPVRQIMLGTTIVMFLFTAGLLKVACPRPLPAFLHWYILAMGLIALGLFGIMIESVYASLLSWMGLAAQYMGGVYMVIAAIASVRESGAWHISLEAALRESEDRFRALVMASSDVVYRMSPDWSEMRRLHGRGFIADTEVPEPDWLAKYIHPNDQSRVTAAINEAIRTKSVFELEHQVLRVDGTLGWTFSRAIPLLNAKGEIVEWFGAASDVTARKQAEQEALRLLSAVQEEKDRLSSLLNSITDEVWFADTNKTFTLANPSAVREFGLSSSDGTGVEKLAASLEVYRGDGTLRPVEEAPPLRALAGDVIRDVEEIVRTPGTGEMRHRQVSAAPVRNAVGSIIGSVSVVRDITERKRADRERDTASEFLRIINQSTDRRALVKAAVMFVHQQSGCEAVGIRLKDGDDYPYYEAHGFPKEFLLLENSLCQRDECGNLTRDSAGDPCIACMCGNVIRGRFDPSKPFFTAAGSFWANDTTRLLANTTAADRQVNTRNRCNGAGYESVALIALRSGAAPMGLLQLNDKRKGMFTPQTIALWERLAGYLAVALAKLSAEEALRQTVADLERSNMELEQFAYISAHDLQEPLRQVRAFVQLLKERHADKLDGKALEYFGYVYDGAARMKELVQGLLDYSLVGSREAIRRPVACQHGLDAALGNLNTSITESHARITHDDLPTVLAEPTQLTQLFQNLLGNAITFHRDGVTPEIHVGCRRDGNWWRFSVKDNGIGIATEHHERVFQIFKRLHGQEKYRGTGIGLAICKKIVEQLGGKIWIESQLNEGSAFCFTLPEDGQE